MPASLDTLERADRPTGLPASGWKDVAERTLARVKEDQLTLLGAGVAFLGLLALIPTLIAAVSIYGLVSDPSDVERQITELTSALPEAARDLLTEQLDSIVASSVGALSLGAILVIPALTSGTAVGDLTGTVLSIARWPLLLVAVAVGLAVLYKMGPDRQDPRLSWASPGALFATVVWVIGSGLFSFYVSRFGSYNETYGSLAGVVILMLWLFLTSTIIIVGATINAELEHRAAEELSRR